MIPVGRDVAAVGRIREPRGFDLKVFSTFAATADAVAFRPFPCIPARDGRAYLPYGIEFTYGQIADAVLALREKYRTAGFGHGHRICLLLENRPDFLVHWLALKSIGVSIVPINSAYRETEIAYLLSHAEPDLVVMLDSQRELSKAVATNAIMVPILVAYLRQDGQLIHDMYLVQVKSPAESKEPWDYEKLVQIVPGKETFATPKDSDHATLSITCCGFS